MPVWSSSYNFSSYAVFRGWFLIHADNFDFQNVSWNEKTTLFSAWFAKISLPEIVIPQLFGPTLFSAHSVF